GSGIGVVACRLLIFYLPLPYFSPLFSPSQQTTDITYLADELSLSLVFFHKFPQRFRFKVQITFNWESERATYCFKLCQRKIAKLYFMSNDQTKHAEILLPFDCIGILVRVNYHAF